MGIATGLALGGLALSATTTGLSFAQAAKERDKMNMANEAAANAMVEARKKLRVNYMDALSINKEAYEMQQDTILAQAQAATQLGIEGDTRGASATAGRVQLATAAGAQQTRVQMGAELQKLEQLSAQEDSRLRDIGVQLDLQEVAGAQAAAREAEARSVAAQQEGIQGATDTLQQGISLGVGLYGADTKGEKAAMQKYSADYTGDVTYTGDVGRGKNKITLEDANLQDVNFEDMTNKQWKDWTGGLDAQQSKSIFGSEAWSNLYQKPVQDPMAWQFGGGTSGITEEEKEMILRARKLANKG